MHGRETEKRLDFSLPPGVAEHERRNLAALSRYLDGDVEIAVGPMGSPHPPKTAEY